MSRDLSFYVEQAVLNLGVKIQFVVMEGVDNHARSAEWETFRKEELKRLFEQYKDLDVKADPVLEGFNILHDNAGIKRRKNIPASENLIKLLKKGEGDLYSINQAVDIYNLISLDSKLALGAHDIDRVDGNVTLRITDGTEKFQPIGQSEPIALNPKEYSYCDDANEILCRCEIRQVAKTQVTEDTQNIFYIVQGNAATPDSLLQETSERIIELTAKYCGGSGKVITPEVI